MPLVAAVRSRAQREAEAEAEAETEAEAEAETEAWGFTRSGAGPHASTATPRGLPGGVHTSYTMRTAPTPWNVRSVRVTAGLTMRRG